MLSNIFYYLTLVSLLSNNSFKVRQDAYDRLELCGEPALPFIVMGQKSNDLEVVTRCRCLHRIVISKKYMDLYPIIYCCTKTPLKNINETSVARATKLLKNYPIIPWLDSLSNRFPDRDNLVYKYVIMASTNSYRNFTSGFNIPEESPSPFPAYQRATRLLVIDLLSNGAAEDTIRRMIHEMALRCKDWNGNPQLLPPEKDLLLED